MNVPLWRNWPHILRMQQFSRADLEAITDHAISFDDAYRANNLFPRLSNEGRRSLQQNATMPRIIRALFYEPSTRTETTFLDAAQLLGCYVHSVKDPKNFSSASKGESLTYAIAAYSAGCDGIVIRSDGEGASEKAADVINTIWHGRGWTRPFFVINAGDGKGQHPTQALVDLTTIKRFRRNDGHFLKELTILFPGELDKSRVVNSLLYALGKFEDCQIKVLFCCPEGLGPKQDLLMYLARHHVQYEFTPEAGFAEAIARADVVYMTRMQRERRSSEGTTSINREAYVFKKEFLALLRPGAFVMHPLPINDDPADPPPEIDRELEPLAQTGDLRCVWLDQSFLGLAVRAALLDCIFAGFDSGYTHQS